MVAASRRRDAKGSVAYLDPCTQAVVKRCSKCSRVRVVSEYCRDPKRRDGYRPQCRACGRALNKAYYEANKDAEYVRTSAWRRTPRGQAASRAASARWRRENVEVLRERKRQEYATNRESITAALRDAAFRRKYGINLAERDEMAASQDSRCAICGGDELMMSKRLAVDHDHETGAVRALLCEHCNNGLGRFGDDPELLEKAAAYLRFHKMVGR